MGHEPRIVNSTIAGFPETLADLSTAQVFVTYDSGETEELFSYYPDEISFVSVEFLGLTRSQALRLKFVRDRAYLRFP